MTSGLPASKAKLSAQEQFTNAADTYLDRHAVYALCSQLLQQLTIHRPSDPIEFLIQQLQSSTTHDAPRILVLAPQDPHNTVPQFQTIITQIAQRHALQHLDLEQMLKDELASQSMLAAQLTTYKQKTNSLPTELLVQMIQQRTHKAANGWILTGFPRAARAELQQLQAAGVLASHVLHIQGNELQLSQQHAPQASLNDSNASLASTELLKTQIAHIDAYRRVEHSLLALLQANRPLSIDATLPLGDLMQRIDKHLQQSQQATSAHSHDTRGVMRCALLGVPGAGSLFQASKLANSTGALLVHAKQLLTDYAQRTGDAAARTAIQHAMSQGKLVDDDAAVTRGLTSRLVVERLLRDDARQRGYILVGYPRTASQCHALHAAGLELNRCVLLECDAKLASQRLMSRRFDPVTQHLYSLHDPEMSPPAHDNELMRRLVTRASDSETVVQQKHADWSKHEASLVKQYSSVLLRVNASRSATVVAQEVMQLVGADLHHALKLQQKQLQQQSQDKQSEHKSAESAATQVGAH